MNIVFDTNIIIDVLAQCALRHSADYIVTRNAADFIGSPVPALTAPELCDLLEQNK